MSQFSVSDVREQSFTAHMSLSMVGEAGGTTLEGGRIATVQECIEALQALTPRDLQRLNYLARVRATGLEPLEGFDLLNEAIARMLDGSRRWPRDVSLVVFLRQTMRSIADSYWSRLDKRKEVPESAVPADAETGDGVVEAAPDVSMEPEARTLASETLARIEGLFRGDEDAMTLISGLANGKSRAEIQTEACMDATRYATTRRRIRRRVIQAFSEGGG